MMVKRLSFFLCAFMLAMSIASVALAASPETDFVFSNGCITGYNGPGGEVEIPLSIGGTPVTSIGWRAFANCTSITSVTIPNSVSKMDTAVFWNCTNLSSVMIPSSVTTISGYTFCFCKNLTSLTIPGNVTSIGNSAFAGCSSLTYLAIPDSVTSIGNSAFQDCSGLTSVNVPNSVIAIGDNTFNCCKNLTSLTIPGNVTSIGNSAFVGCSSLTSLTIPDSVISIGANAFNGCSNLMSINVGDGNLNYSSLDGVLFDEAKTQVVQYPAGKLNPSYTLPDGVTTIGDSAFYNCNNLTSLIIPNGVTTIGDSAFYNCSNLTSLNLPNSITTIGKRVFSECKHLHSLSIPNGVTSIGESAFYGCTFLYSLDIPDSVISIGNSAFASCLYLSFLNIPKSVTFIGDSAFSNCYSLNSLAMRSDIEVMNAQIPSTVVSWTISEGSTSIKKYQWEDITSLKSVSIPEGITSIQSGAFIRASKLLKIILPSTITGIGDYAFYGCSSLGSVMFKGDAPQTLGTGMFDGSASNFVIKYYEGKTGWTAPIWNGYPSEAISFVITYYSNGGSSVASAKGYYGSVLFSPEVPTKAGYIFDGWCKDVALSSPWDFTNDVITADTTLYARWKPNIYTLSFDLNGGDSLESTPTSYEYGRGTLLPIPARDHYNFIGWYDNPDFAGRPMTSVGLVAPGDKTLTAQWQIQSFKVFFNSQGGSAVGSVNADYAATAAQPANPIRAGYYFVGWYKDAACSIPWDFAVNKVISDTTIYAKWALGTYTITLNGNGGSITGVKFYTYGTGYTLPTPTRSGYTFGGWYDTLDNRAYLVSATDAGDKIYYAQWNSNSNYLTKVNKSTGKWRKTWSKSRTSNVLTISRSKNSAKLKAAISANAKAYVKYSGGSYSNITGKYKTVKVSKGKSKTLYIKVVSQSGKSRTYKVVVKRSR